jgi:radical SAM protein with 4Fe4S-binding SPASM domain
MLRVLQLKELNARMGALQLVTQDYSFETMPQWVSFTTTTFCNLRCLHCLTHGTEEARSLYNRQNWSDETLTRVAKESLPWAYEYCLTLNGEPLCTSRLKEKIEELAYYGARLHITTNGTLFSKELLIRLLPLAGTIDISIDGATELTCETIRLGANFRKLLNNIRLLTRICELLPSKINPNIGLVYTVMGSTIKEMPEMVRLAHALKVPRVGFFPLIICYPHVRGEDLNLHKSLYNAYYELTQKEAERLNLMVTMPDPFPDTEADANVPVRGDDLIIKELPQNYYETLPSPESFLDYPAIETKAAEIVAGTKQHLLDAKAVVGEVLIEELRVQIQISFKALLDRWKADLKRLAGRGGEKIRYCDNLFRRAFINIEGDVTPCCIPERPVLGNIYKNAIKEIWNGNLYNDFRKKFYSSDPPDCCKGCRFITYMSKQVFLNKVSE